jgi:hypothetical protein
MVNATPVIAVLSCNGSTVTTDQRPATRLIVATLKGVKIFERGGAEDAWELRSTALEDKHISAILYEPRSGLVFAGAHWNQGLYVSRDGGFTYEPSMNGITRPHIYALAAQHRGDQTILFAGTEPSALYRSDDLGASWKDLPGIWDVPETDQWKFPPPPHVAHVKDIAWHPSNPRRLYVCIEQGALLISDDDGQSWTENRGYADVEQDMFRHDNHRVLFQSNPSHYIMCGGEGLDVTFDDGASWSKVMKRSDRIGYPDAMFIDPRDENTVYVAGPQAGPGLWAKWGTSNPTFMASRDFGRTWQERRNGLPDDLVGNIEAMGLHHHGDEVTIFAGTATGEIYVTGDAGLNWSRLATGLPSIAKNGHFRWFLPEAERAAAEEMMRECGEAYT